MLQVVLIPHTGLMEQPQRQFTDRETSHSSNHSRLQKKDTTNAAYEPHSPISIIGNSDFIAQATVENWSGNGSTKNPYIIERLGIGSENRILILILYTDVHFRIQNCYLNQGRMGIYLFSVKNAQLSNNIVINNNKYGIHLEDSENNILSNNIVINNNEEGIYLRDSAKNILVNNTITRNYYRGIEVRYSENNIVTNNTVVNNRLSGLWFIHSPNNALIGNTFTNNLNGIMVWYSNNSFVAKNTVTNNTEDGIYVYDSSNCKVIRNHVANNSRRGLWLLSLSENNTIQFNNFQANNDSVVDSGWKNIFEQNYWSDWTSPDDNGDGIVDQPYPIHEENVDPYPLVEPNSIPPGLDPHLIALYITPNGGEILQGTIDIQWGIFDLGNHEMTYTVSYSENGGGTWTQLTTGLKVPGYSWDVTDMNGSQYLVQVNASCTEGARVEITSRAPFTIYDNHFEIKAFTILVPKGGKIYYGSVTIQWTSAVDRFSHEVSYTVSYSADDGFSWNTLTTNLVHTTYEWDTTTVMNGSQYLIRIKARCSEGKSRESTSAPFTIKNPHAIQPLTLLTPEGGKTYFNPIIIHWTPAVSLFNHEVTYVISYSADNGNTWKTLTSNLNTTTFVWDSKTEKDSSQYLIQVNASCEEGAWYIATSNAFTIDNIPRTTNFPIVQTSTHPMRTDTPLNLLPLLQLLSPVVILTFLVTLVTIIRRQQI